MAKRVFNVALVLGTLMLLTVCWVFVQHQELGVGGIVLTVSAVLLIGMSVWRKIDVSVSEKGFTAKLEQVEAQVKAVKEQAIKSEEKAGEAYAAVGKLKRSIDVRNAQAVLSAAGFKVFADGFLGPQTINAIKQFQVSKGLNESGELDAATMRALNLEPMS